MTPVQEGRKAHAFFKSESFSCCSALDGSRGESAEDSRTTRTHARTHARPTVLLWPTSVVLRCTSVSTSLCCSGFQFAWLLVLVLLDYRCCSHADLTRPPDRSAVRDKTMTMTTFIDDVSNHCQSSGPVGISDGVMTPRKKHRTSGGVMSAVGSKKKNSKETVRRQCVEMCAKFTH